MQSAENLRTEESKNNGSSYLAHRLLVFCRAVAQVEAGLGTTNASLVAGDLERYVWPCEMLRRKRLERRLRPGRVSDRKCKTKEAQKSVL